MIPNHYKTLGVPRSALPVQIREAYLAIAAKEHPDRGGDASKFAAASAAYRTLYDYKERTKYDSKVKLLAHPCTECRGEGSIRRQRGLTAAVNVPCAKCEGTGVMS